MKILVLNYEYPPIGGGGGPVSKDLAEEYAKAGDDVAVVTMRYGSAPEKAVENGVTVYRLNCKRSRSDACSPIEQYSYLKAVRVFMKAHEELRQFDVCHTHFVIPTGQAALEIKKNYGIPYILTAHGSDVEGHNRKKSMLMIHRLLRGGWRKIVDGAEYVVAPSAYLKQRMEHNYPQGKYVLIPNGMDYPLYSGLNNREKKEKRILIMGRLQKFKNVQFIIEALAQLNREEKLTGWLVDIAGDGPYRQELEQLTREKGLEGMICFHGWLKHKSERLNELLERASVYVSASMFENCPMSVIEAVSAGCYPLISDIPAHRQLISEEKHLFTLRDASELAGRLEKVLQSEAPVDDIPDFSQYDIKRIADKYRSLLSACLG